jgi:hypothetical protein
MGVPSIIGNLYYQSLSIGSSNFHAQRICNLGKWLLLTCCKNTGPLQGVNALNDSKEGEEDGNSSEHIIKFIARLQWSFTKNVLILRTKNKK